MSDITGKFTQKTERGKQESRALTVRRLGLVNLEPKLPKTTVSAPSPG